jgi:hypothetical protein
VTPSEVWIELARRDHHQSCLLLEYIKLPGGSVLTRLPSSPGSHVEIIVVSALTDVVAARFAKRILLRGSLACGRAIAGACSIASDGSIWFTDPTYGIGEYYEGIKAEPEQEKHNVYRWGGHRAALPARCHRAGCVTARLR